MSEDKLQSGAYIISPKVGKILVKAMFFLERLNKNKHSKHRANCKGIIRDGPEFDESSSCLESP